MTSCYVAVPKAANNVSYGTADGKKPNANDYFSKGSRASSGSSTPGGGGGYIEEGDYMGEGGGKEEFLGTNVTAGPVIQAAPKGGPNQRSNVSCYAALPK